LQEGSPAIDSATDEGIVQRDNAEIL